MTPIPTIRVLYDLVARDGASRSFDSAGRSASGLERNFARLGKAIAVAGTATAAAAVAIGYESIKAATEFQSSMEKIHTQAGATQKDVAKLSAEVLKMAPSAQQGPQELAQAMFHLKSVGLDNVKAMKALRAASDLAAVGGANLEDTTNAIAGAWRSGIKGAGSFAQAAGTVNAIIGAGNMKMEDFVQSLSSGILPAARTFGVSLKSVGSAMALMTDEGIPAELAATRLRMTLSLIGAPSKKAGDILQGIGIKSTDLANAMRGPGGLVAAIQMLHDHLVSSGESATKQAQTISNAFGGGRSSSAIMTLLNNLDVLKKKQDQINATMGRFGPDVTAQRKTAQAQFDLLKSGLDTILIRIGSKLLPPVTSFVGYLAKTGIPAAVTFATDLGNLIPVGQIETDISKAAKVVGDFIAGLTAHTGTTKRVQVGHMFMVEQPPQLSSSAKAGQSLRDTFANSLFGGSEATGELTSKATLWLESALSKIDWNQIGQKEGNKAGGLITGLAGGIFGLAKGGLQDQFTHGFSGFIKSSVHNVALANPGAAGALAIGRGVGTDILKGANSALWDVTHFLRKKGAQLITGFANGAQVYWSSSALPWLKSIPQRIQDAFARPGNWLLHVGGQVILGLLGGIRAKMAGIGSWIRGTVVDPVINAVKSFFGIHSPSTVMHGIGVNLVLGLIRGLVHHNPLTFVKKIFGSIPDALGSLVEKGLVSLTSLPRKALGALEGLGGKLGGFLSHLFGGGGGGAGVQQWAGTVLQVLKMLGQPASDLGVVLSQMNTESGGNPHAINLTDSNARAGDPSRGLMQTIGSTFDAYAGPFRGLGIYNPLANIYAGLNYAIHRYGAGWTSVLGHGHGYAEGTTGAKPGWAMVGERGMELVRFRGGEDVIEHGASMRLLRGYAKGTLTKKQEEGLRLFDSFMNHPTSKSTIHSDFASLIKEIRKFYDGAKQRWRVQDAHRAEDKMERKSRQLSQVRSQIAAARSYAKSTRSSLMGSAALSNITLPAQGIINGAPVATGSSITQGLRDKLNSLRQFGAAIKKLHAKHLSNALLRQIINMGPDDGLPYAQAILTGGGGIISQLNQTESAIGKTARSVSRSAADALYDKGKDAGKGFLSGLRGERAGLEKEMRHMADTWGKEAMRWLNVPRSSLPKHLRHRVHHRVHHRAMGGLITEPVVGYGLTSGDQWQFGESGAEMVTPASGGGMAPVCNFEVRVFVGDREITDIVRTEVRESNRGIKRRVNAGAGRAP